MKVAIYGAARAGGSCKYIIWLGRLGAGFQLKGGS